VEPNQPTITVEKLTKNYGPVMAVNGISFEVNQGEVVGFLGPNGAGKSTTMRILSGLIPATSGSVSICGIPAAQTPRDIKKILGYMPENNPLPPDMRVTEYLQFRGQLKNIPAKKLKTRIQEVLELCDLHRKAYRKVIGSLSKGFRQRVGIADAILAEPLVAILDEPTIGLDPHQVLLIRELIQSLRGKMSLIISSHILAEVEVSCDRIIIINQGHVVANGTLDNLRDEFIKRTTYELIFKGNIRQVVETVRTLYPDFTVHPVTGNNGAPLITAHLKTAIKEDLSTHLLSALQQTPGITVNGFHRLQSHLEDIFLSATKRSWEIEQNPSETYVKPTETSA
jgi:ABC-2 type transport system ATP-binding protein